MELYGDNGFQHGDTEATETHGEEGAVAVRCGRPWAGRSEISRERGCKLPPDRKQLASAPSTDLLPREARRSGPQGAPPFAFVDFVPPCLRSVSSPPSVAFK